VVLEHASAPPGSYLRDVRVVVRIAVALDEVARSRPGTARPCWFRRPLDLAAAEIRSWVAIDIVVGRVAIWGRARLDADAEALVCAYAMMFMPSG